MKKILFPVSIVFVLSWSCAMVLAQEKGTAKNQTPRDQQMKKFGVADPNDPRVRARIMAAKRKERDLERRKKVRRERLKALEAKRLEREKARGVRDIDQLKGEAGKARGPEQQLKALTTQIAHEQAKHLKRIARLKKIQGLAAEGGSTKITARVKKLLRKEQQRYDRKRQRMNMRKRMLMSQQVKKRPGRQPGKKSLNREKPRVAEQDYLKKTKGKDKTKTDEP